MLQPLCLLILYCFFTFDEEVAVRAVVVATGTFLNGLVHVGLKHFGAGRLGDFPATRLADWFKAQGFVMGRLKTGTVPRLDSNSIMAWCRNFIREPGPVV